MVIDEDIDLERVVIDAEYRCRVLRYLNGHTALLSPKNIDLNRVIADAEYRREAVHLLNGPMGVGSDRQAGKATIVSWRLLRAAARFHGKVGDLERCKSPLPLR